MSLIPDVATIPYDNTFDILTMLIYRGIFEGCFYIILSLCVLCLFSQRNKAAPLLSPSS